MLQIIQLLSTGITTSVIIIAITTAYKYIMYMWLDLQKGVLYTQL